MPERIHVTPATPEHSRGLARIQIETWRAAYASIVDNNFLESLSVESAESRFRDLILDPTIRCWAATVGEELAGYAIIGSNRQPEFSGDVEVRALYVLPRYQRFGVGRTLLQFGLQYELEAGAHSAIVWAFAENHRARDFYQSIGGTPAGESTFELGGIHYPDIAFLLHPIERVLARLEPVEIRPVQSTDDIAEINALVHRAYKQLADQGLRYTATIQSDQHALKRLTENRGHLVVRQGVVVGTVVLTYPDEQEYGTWISPGPLASFSMFCVDPELQGLGIGTRVLRWLERESKALGASWLALDTASTATELIAMYERFGFQCVGQIDYRPNTNYESVVMAKSL